ncbi:MAG: DUF5671 domain-containing protein [Candidatus Eisenbacteria bacterium]
MNADLNAYVREALARGLSRDAIRTQLAAARWRREEVEAALAAWADGEGGVPVPRRRVSLDAREAFLHLVLFATLYTSAYSTGAILFWLIERHLHDAAMYSNSTSFEPLRWAVAAAVTAFPIYLWTSALAARWLAAEPEKRSSGVRRWLTYLTLFVAAQVMIGDFVGVISSLLAGEQTARSLLKAVVVFAIAGLVFGHYLGGLRRDEAESEAAAPRRVSWLGVVGVAGVVLTLVVALFSMGSPKQARGRELDARRVNHLDQVELAVREYRRTTGRLPEGLHEIEVGTGERMGMPMLPRDPETNAFYAYGKLDSARFQVGARFATADTLDGNGQPIPLRWRHGRGQVLFERDVSKGR